jgi:L-lactate utilization protein LutC
MRTPLVWQTGQKLLPRILGPILKSGKTGWLPGPAGAWLKGRDLPPLPTKSFTSRWRDRQRAPGKKTDRPKVEPHQDGTEAIERTRRSLAISKGISHAPAPPPFGPLPEVEISDPVERFCKEFQLAGGHSYRHESLEATKETICDLANRFSGRPIAVSENLPLAAGDWLKESGHEVLPLSPPGEDCRDSLSQSGLGITDCDWAIAETGTLVLTSSPHRPRLYSLLPEVHLVLIPEERVIPHLSAAGPHIHRALTSGGDSPSCVNLITGPSRSADIGLTLVTGVHGPCEIHAILIPADTSDTAAFTISGPAPFSLEEE